MDPAPACFAGSDPRSMRRPPSCTAMSAGKAQSGSEPPVAAAGDHDSPRGPVPRFPQALRTLCQPQPERPSVERLQLLARLEANGLPGRNGHFGAGARVASDARLAGPDREDAESTEFDAVAQGERALHGLKHR